MDRAAPVARIGLRKLIWRLRNRLIVAYVFIAVVPILLMLTLVGLGAYMLAGQVAVYLVRSELDRRLVTSMRSAGDSLTRARAGSRLETMRQDPARSMPGDTLASRF